MLMLAGVRSHLTFSEAKEEQMPLFCLCLCCGASSLPSCLCLCDDACVVQSGNSLMVTTSRKRQPPVSDHLVHMNVVPRSTMNTNGETEN